VYAVNTAGSSPASAVRSFTTAASSQQDGQH
jgi:hypothetical protein